MSCGKHKLPQKLHLLVVLSNLQLAIHKHLNSQRHECLEMRFVATSYGNNPRWKIGRSVYELNG